MPARRSWSGPRPPHPFSTVGRRLSRRVDAIAAGAGIQLVFGAPWYRPRGRGEILQQRLPPGWAGGRRRQVRKRHLVPFGEYISHSPGALLRRETDGGSSDFSSGTTPSLFRVDGSLVAASVCYEAIFPGILRDGVREGATWLVNVTNDAWFGDTVAPHQHLAMARIRCVELRRPMVLARRIPGSAR